MFIPCSSDCLYQQEGCCQLSTSSVLRGSDHAAYSKCPYYVNKTDAMQFPPPEGQLTEPRRLL